MTDTINNRLAKLQAKINNPTKLEKAAFQNRIEHTKKTICMKCFKRLFNQDEKHMYARKLYCGKCYDKTIDEIILKKTVDT